MAATYVDPSFDDFVNLLTQDEAMLIQMGILKSYKLQALVASEPKVLKELGKLEKKKNKKKS